MKYITGDGVTAAHIKRIAKKLKLKLWPSEKKPFFSEFKQAAFPKGLNIIAADITEDKLHSFFELPIENIIDAKSLDDSVVDFVSHETRGHLTHSLGFILTCPVIYACDVAQIFTEALNKRLKFSSLRYGRIHLALHEALVNGLIHGNLQMGSELRQSAQDFVEYSRILKERLTDPAFARKSVSIWATWDKKKLEIKIRDEGAGYAVSTTMQKKPDDVRSKSGRGLKLIASTADSCTIDDFGREITLSFMLKSRQHYEVSESMFDDQTEEPRVSTDLSACRVLVMEDNLSNQTLIGRLLNVVGITQIEMAGDGIEGLQKVAANLPDLIILDITMPRMNGYEVLHHLKSAPETKDIPVLIQTASDTRETRDKTFSSGATDFISKPINPLEFFARVKVHLENKLLIRNLESKLSQLDEELRGAQKIQVDMLPSEKTLKSIRSKYDLDITHAFYPSSKLGGDFWQLFPISSTQLAVYLCDFSGHGVAAALNTVRLHTLVEQMNKAVSAPSSFLQKVNAQLYEVLPRGQFATLFCAIIDVEKRNMTYAGAGVPPPFLCSRGRIKQLKTEGMPLGIVARPSYEDHEVRFERGDTLLMFSDALTETPNAKGERLGEDGFEKMVTGHFCTIDVRVALQDIMDSFFEFAPPPPPDDATTVLVRFMP